MNIIRRWREKREREWWERFHREHRWDELARYNTERSHGIVHTAGYTAHMEDEQRAFYEEQGVERWDDNGDGIVGRSKYGWISRR